MQIRLKAQYNLRSGEMVENVKGESPTNRDRSSNVNGSSTCTNHEGTGEVRWGKGGGTTVTSLLIVHCFMHLSG